MTTTSLKPLICECGHMGNLKRRENNQPFSKLWEEYSLEEFDGGTVTVTADNKRPGDLLAVLKPKCPECGKAGKVSFFKE